MTRKQQGSLGPMSEGGVAHTDVLIVGAGISGIGTACHLRRRLPSRRFVILEGREAIGGTWDLFRYPGVRSDSDMFTFGYAFKPWVEEDDIATGDAILNYLEETVEEYALREHIRFGHRVERLSWSSEERRWTAYVRRGDGAQVQFSADVLVTCTGYYRYARGHVPEIEGMEAFEGELVEPQRWPGELDYRGKRVVVVGSGATAVTIVPAMAREAEHVTMLQRSPTYIVSRPASDRVAQWMRRVLPEKMAYDLARLKAISLQRFLYVVARAQPGRVRDYVLRQARAELGDAIDVQTHFNPRYEPWDQRMCLIPDADLFVALREGRASVVTDRIVRMVPGGLLLEERGEVLEADVVVLATGLELEFLGGASMEVDGEELEPHELVCYRGMMFGGVPNWVAMFGYSSASWTLKTDLSANFLCRVLERLDEGGYEVFVPEAQGEMKTRSILDNLSDASYVKRGEGRLPRQGERLPWRNQDSYFSDFIDLRLRGLDDGVLRFE